MLNPEIWSGSWVVHAYACTECMIRHAVSSCRPIRAYRAYGWVRMSNRAILPVSGVKQGLFTARPTPRLEYEVADTQNNSLTPPGRGSGSTHPHLRGNEPNTRSPPAHHQKINGVFGVPHLSERSLPGRGRIQVYIPPQQAALKRYPHTDIETALAIEHPRTLSCRSAQLESTIPLHSYSFPLHSSITTCSLRLLVA